MQPKRFLYFLTDDPEQGRSYDVDKDGELVKTSQPVPLKYSPDGWQDKMISVGRNNKYFGLFRSFTVPLKFVKVGARILRELFWTNSIEAKVGLVISRLNTDTYVHDPFYRGEVDMSTFNDNDEYVQANVIEGGLSKLIKANEGKVYEIPVDVPEAVKIRMDGHYLSEVNNWLVPKQISGDGAIVGTMETTSEGNAAGIATFSIFSGDAPPGDLSTSKEYFFALTQDITGIRISGKVIFSYRLGSAGNYHLELKTNTGKILQIASLAVVAGQTYELEFDYTFDGLADEKYFLINNTPGIVAVYYESMISVSYRSKFRETTINALRPLYVFQQLIKKITEGSGLYTAASDLLVQNEDIVVTCTDAVIGLKGAKIRTSLQEFFEAYNTQLNCSLGVEGNTARLERKAYSFRKDLVCAEVGEVMDLETSAAIDHFYNTYKVGYKNQESDTVNSVNEFNTTLEFNSPITRVSKELPLICPYRADPVGIELTRMNLDGKTSVEDQTTNDTCLLHIGKVQQADGSFMLDRSLNVDATGIENIDSVFNIHLSPRRMFYRHGDYLRIGLHRLESYEITFRTSDKNRMLESRQANGVIEKEGSDIGVMALSPALALPYIFQFKTKVPENILEAVEAAPMGVIKFTYDGLQLEGFILEVSTKPATRQEQQWKLLCSPNVDVKKLIA